MIYVGFLLLAAIVVFLSIKLSDYVDLLDKNTNVSGAFIGGILLAAVTSLPELFTSISAVLFLHENNLVLGNILGSNIFNFAALGTCVAIMFIAFNKAKLGKHHLITLLLTMLVYGLIAIAIFIKNVPMLGFVNIVSPFIFIIYVVSLFTTPKIEEPEESEKTNVSVKTLIAKFIIAAVLLIGVSITITYVTDYIAEKLDLGKTFAGALLLGLTTSLPELVSTVSLCRRGNFNASAGNILGSNVFNFFILFLADVLSFKKGNTVIFNYFASGTAGEQSALLLILGISACLLTAVMFSVKAYAPNKQLLGKVTTPVCGYLITSCYILFLILSTTVFA